MRRLKAQALSMDVFGRLELHDELSLDRKFVRKKAQIFSLRTQGFGYWTWKPYLIERVLQKLNDGEVLVYSDVGNHFNSHARDQLSDYISLASASPVGICAPRLSDRFSEREWTKRELLKYFDVETDVTITNSPQFEANFIVIVAGQHSRSFIRRWNDTHERRLDLFDGVFRCPQFDGFREHRHDQSVFSILGKIYRVAKIPSDRDDFVKRLRDKPMIAANTRYLWFLVRNGLLVERLCRANKLGRAEAAKHS